jgi:transposase
MGDKLTKDERVTLVFMYGKAGATHRSVAEDFNRQNPRRLPIDKSSVGRLINRFKETGSVADRPRSGRPKSATDPTSTAVVLATLTNSPKKSTRKLSQETGVSQRSVLRILHRHHFHPYKVHLVQELHGDDLDRRKEYCEWFLRNSDLSIFFSDEAMFYLSGHVNRHNCRYWSDINPRWMQVSHVQNDPRIMVWAGIWEDQLIGPYFFDGNVTGETYLHMLSTFLLDYMCNVPLAKRLNMFFQQDGAPPHYALIVRDFLNEHFPNKWIGRRGPVEWPPRSPDLTPLDYYLWGHLKSVVYQTRPRNKEELKERIRNECSQITEETLRRVNDSCRHRIEMCCEKEGGHFEQHI